METHVGERNPNPWNTTQSLVLSLHLSTRFLHCMWAQGWHLVSWLRGGNYIFKLSWSLFLISRKSTLRKLFLSWHNLEEVNDYITQSYVSNSISNDFGGNGKMARLETQEAPHNGKNVPCTVSGLERQFERRAPTTPVSPPLLPPPPGAIETQTTWCTENFVDISISLAEATAARKGPKSAKSFMPKSPESEILAKFFAKNAAKKWRIFLPIFVLQFPGKVGARNFTKNWRQIRLAVK